MSRILRQLFAILIAYPVALVWLGLLVRHRERLPNRGPAILVANHNSHLDILALFSLFPLRIIPDLRPVAAADYFLKNRLSTWFSLKVVGIIPVLRSARKASPDPLSACDAALEQGEIIIIFPEGSRGDPEVLTKLKSGIWHLVQRFPDVPVTPIFMYGLGRSMPKGEWFPLPVFVDIFIGRTVEREDDKQSFMQRLTDRFRQLQAVATSGREQA